MQKLGENFFGSQIAMNDKVFLLEPKIFGSLRTRILKEGLSEIAFSVPTTRLAFKNLKFRITENANEGRTTPARGNQHCTWVPLPNGE